jgi:hypothetical protein
MSVRDPLHRLLRGLPARRAPVGLEERVLRAIRQQADAPWWRRSFRHWPLPACVAFVLACGASLGLIWWGGSRVPVETLALGGVGGMLMSWLHAVSAALATANHVGQTLSAVFTHVLPSQWLYGILLLCGSLYAALFLMGAAAYRAFGSHSPAQDHSS